MKSQNRASNYGFTDGVINTNPTIGGSALSDNRAKFLPEPRVGIAYDVFGNGKTAYARELWHASRAARHARLPPRPDRAVQHHVFVQQHDRRSSWPASQPERRPGSGLISPSNVQPNIATPTVLAWTVKLEQQIAPATSLTIGYVGSHGYNQILSEDQNTPPTVVCPDASCPATLAARHYLLPNDLRRIQTWPTPPRGFRRASVTTTRLKSTFADSLSHGLQLRGVYTWASNLDDGSAWNTSVSANTPAFVMYPGNPKLDYGLAATNIRNAAAISGTWELPFGARVPCQCESCDASGGRRMVGERHRDLAKRLSLLAAAWLQPHRQRRYAKSRAPESQS